ncbi:MAG: glycosyltransferase [bacterium]
MRKPNLHILGLFHTIPNHDYSTCAFTTKVRNFSKMMNLYGFNTIEYANEGSLSDAKEKVVILKKEEFKKITKKPNSLAFQVAEINSKLHLIFQNKLIKEIINRAEDGDIICHPFAHTHKILIDILPNCYHVETGIGYPDGDFGAFRIFESYAWMHYHQGKENRNGHFYEWVVPNYFDTSKYEPSYKKGDYLIYFGRIIENKGLEIVKKIAENINIEVRLYGDGDKEKYYGKNMHFYDAIRGNEKDKSNVLKKAKAILMPTLYTEPFGGSGIEATLCGTPIISTDYGAFTETVLHGINGYRCHTLGDFLNAVEEVDSLDRKVVSDIAMERYSMETIGAKYNSIFRQISDLSREGWNNKKSFFI